MQILTQRILFGLAASIQSFIQQKPAYVSFIVRYLLPKLMNYVQKPSTFTTSSPFEALLHAEKIILLTAWCHDPALLDMVVDALRQQPTHIAYFIQQMDDGIFRTHTLSCPPFEEAKKLFSLFPLIPSGILNELTFLRLITVFLNINLGLKQPIHIEDYVIPLDELEKRYGPSIKKRMLDAIATTKLQEAGHANE